MIDHSISHGSHDMIERTMINASELTAHETAALLHFYADAGVDILLEENAVDLTVQTAVAKRKHLIPEPTLAETRLPSRREQTLSPKAAAPEPQDRHTSIGTSTIPDEKAVSNARLTAEGARSLAELKVALNSFDSCNLKNNARSTISLEAIPETGLLAVCGFPTGDDDRAGEALSGKAGGLFSLMLGAINLPRDSIAIMTAIPWRTPGDRSPTLSETDICLPFLERQLALAQPKTLLVLGNFASRMLIDRKKTVFDLRGKWHTLTIGGQSFTALVTFSPTELLAAPANKKLAWQDLQTFKKALS